MEFSTLMNGPWGKQDKNSKEIKAELLNHYFKEFDEWKKTRTKQGRWLTGIVVKRNDD